MTQHSPRLRGATLNHKLSDQNLISPISDTHLNFSSKCVIFDTNGLLAPTVSRMGVGSCRQDSNHRIRIGHAGLAQLVEHVICNHGVAGSIPAAGTSTWRPSAASVSPQCQRFCSLAACAASRLIVFRAPASKTGDLKGIGVAGPSPGCRRNLKDTARGDGRLQPPRALNVAVTANRPAPLACGAKALFRR